MIVLLLHLQTNTSTQQVARCTKIINSGDEENAK
jgi:hypothetical protein